MRLFLLVCGLVSFLPQSGFGLDKKLNKKETKQTLTQKASSNNSLKNKDFKSVPLNRLVAADHSHQDFRHTPYGGMEEQDLLHARPSWEAQDELASSDSEGEEATSRSVAQESADDGVEKISVTGSRIKRTDTEGPSPLLVIDKEQIEQSGYNSLSDILRDMPFSSTGGVRESALDTETNVSSITIRGSKDVLVLLNGQRMVYASGIGKKVDLNAVPVSMIERVEVLKDSASSIYGADAVGGIINIITKRNYSGGQVNVRGSLVQRKEGNEASSFASFLDFPNWNKGDKLSVDAFYGGSQGEWDYMVGGQFKFDAPLYMRDREFAGGESPFGSFGSYSQDDGKTIKHKLCPKSDGGIDNEDGYCRFDFSPYMQFFPGILQGSAFLQAGRDIGQTSFFTTALYSHTRSASELAPPPDSFAKPSVEGKSDYRIPFNVAQSWGLELDQNPESLITVWYRPVFEKGAGTRKTSTNTHFYQLQSHLSHPFRDTLEFEAKFNFSGYHAFANSTGYLSKKTLYDMALAGEFNPFLPKDKKNDISKASVEPQRISHNLLANVEPVLTGELIQIHGQPVGFAVGNLTAWERYSESVKVPGLSESDDVWGGNSPSTGSGSRFFGGLYGELSTIQARDMLEVQASARTDFYSDVGMTLYRFDIGEDRQIHLPFSPGAKLTFQPVDQLKLRTSWNMGFKAPTLADLHHTQFIDHPSAKDVVYCEGKEETYCSEGAQHETFKTGNKELEPETFQAFNVGVVFEPIKQFSFNVDYYMTNQKNTITMPEPKDIFEYEKSNTIEAVRKRGLNVDRVGGNGRVKAVNTKPINSGFYKVRGVDIQAQWVGDGLWNNWNLVLNTGYTYMLYLERQVFTDGPINCPVPYPQWVSWIDNPCGSSVKPEDNEKRVGTHDGYPRWRNRSSLGFVSKDKKYQFALVAHNIPGQLKTAEYDNQKKIDAATEKSKKKAQKDGKEFKGLKTETDYYVQLDFMAAVAFNKQHGITLGVKNILGTDRPYNKVRANLASSDPIGPAYTGALNTRLYSIVGRTIDVRYTYNF